MKMMYNGTQIKSLNVKHYEVSTNDCDMIASDLQAGKTAVARGKKITGTGKSFEFATYGELETNRPNHIPSLINVVEVTSVDYPIRSLITFRNMLDVDFSTEQAIGTVVINNIEYPITIRVDGSILTINCEKTISLEVFLGKDRYI